MMPVVCVQLDTDFYDLENKLNKLPVSNGINCFHKQLKKKKGTATEIHTIEFTLMSKEQRVNKPTRSVFSHY